MAGCAITAPQRQWPETCFFVRPGTVSPPRPAIPRWAPRTAAVKTGRRPPAPPARSGLDGGEHGARLLRVGRRVITAAQHSCSATARLPLGIASSRSTLLTRNKIVHRRRYGKTLPRRKPGPTLRALSRWIGGSRPSPGKCSYGGFIQGGSAGRWGTRNDTRSIRSKCAQT